MFSSLRLGCQQLVLKNISSVISTRANMCSAASEVSKYETLLVTEPKPFVYHVVLNRPERFNAFNKIMWLEIGKCFNELSDNANCRVIVLSANGKHFAAGIDLQDMLSMGQDFSEIEDVSRKAKYLSKNIKAYQDSVSSLESCVKPVIAAVHSACVGAGVDLITAADIRYCSKDSWFQVKEVDIGMAADVGTLQRLPKVIGNASLARELCFTARKLKSDEALNCGLVSKVFDNSESLVQGALQLAEDISTKSPVAVQLTKKTLVYSLDHTNQEGLDYIGTLNECHLQSEDFITACMAQATKGDKPVFSKL